MMNLKGKAKQQNREERLREQQIAEAKRAGNLMSFFINGGNGAKWGDVESAKLGVVMALAYTKTFIAPAAFDALLREMGITQGYNAMGTPILKHDASSFPKRS